MPESTSAELSNVSASASSVTLLAKNGSRMGAVIANDSSATLYVKFGTAASTTSYTYRLESNDILEFPEPIYTGTVTGIWDSATGSARVTELS